MIIIMLYIHIIPTCDCASAVVKFFRYSKSSTPGNNIDRSSELYYNTVYIMYTYTYVAYHSSECVELANNGRTGTLPWQYTRPQQNISSLHAFDHCVYVLHTQ